jgi:CDP-6-deoxy-D-xylo-4-hexulose-3-dehydrase
MGYNLKPLDLQGALGLVQLKKFEEIHKRRTNNHLKLFNTIKLLPHVSNVAPLPGSDTSWFGVPIICESGATKRGLVKHLEDAKVQTRNYFAGNILLHPGYRHLDNSQLYPNANQVLDKVFFLGCSPTISEEMLNYIITILKSFSYEKI